MKSYQNFDLYGYNTMHLHCMAKEVYCPESVEELKGLLIELRNNKQNYGILGAGSNVILPAKINTPVIILTSFNKELRIDNGLVTVGASVRVQHLIREAQKREMGGIEYLFSVPCTVGGATVMNAGKGNGKQSIGNYIKDVQCLNMDTFEYETLTKEECEFGFRSSIFLHSNRIVLSTTFILDRIESQLIEDRINERKQYALEKLDDRRPSSGSIFKKANSRILKVLKGLRIGGAEWSKKTNNWISNRGNAKNWQIRMLVYIACFLHRITFQSYNLEVEIWK